MNIIYLKLMIDKCVDFEEAVTFYCEYKYNKSKIEKIKEEGAIYSIVPIKKYNLVSREHQTKIKTKYLKL